MTKNATIIANGDLSTGCTIRDISNGGMRVSVISAMQLPPEILIVCRSEDLVARGAIRWRSANELGLSFLRKGKMAEEAAFRDEQRSYFSNLINAYNAQQAQMKNAAEEAAKLEAARIADMWRTMGLDPQAQHTNDVLKSAYKKLAMKNHPDVGGDANAFQRINDAYVQLSKQFEMSA